MGESEHALCARRVYLAEKNNKIPKRGFRWFLCFPGRAGHMRLREVLSPGAAPDSPYPSLASSGGSGCKFLRYQPCCSSSYTLLVLKVWGGQNQASIFTEVNQWFQLCELRIFPGPLCWKSPCPDAGWVLVIFCWGFLLCAEERVCSLIAGGCRASH